MFWIVNPNMLHRFNETKLDIKLTNKKLYTSTMFFCFTETRARSRLMTEEEEEEEEPERKGRRFEY